MLTIPIIETIYDSPAQAKEFAAFIESFGHKAHYISPRDNRSAPNVKSNQIPYPTSKQQEEWEDYAQQLYRNFLSEKGKK